jgi:hypothetical protein
LTPPEQDVTPEPALPQGLTVDVDPVQVAAVGNELPVSVKLFLPRGVKLNAEVPMTYVVKIVDGDQILNPEAVGKRITVAESETEFQIALPLAKKTGSATLQVSLAYFYCETTALSLCKIGNVNWVAPVELKPGARADHLTLEYAVR